jgi:hypothetical protein
MISIAVSLLFVGAVCLIVSLVFMIKTGFNETVSSIRHRKASLFWMTGALISFLCANLLWISAYHAK